MLLVFFLFCFNGYRDQLINRTVENRHVFRVVELRYNCARLRQLNNKNQYGRLPIKLYKMHKIKEE